MEKHETYVSQELAIKMIHAGFTWNEYLVSHQIDLPFKWEIPLHIAQKWLREVMKINVEVMYLFEPCNHYFARACNLSDNSVIRMENCSDKNYEKALELGISFIFDNVIK